MGRGGGGFYFPGPVAAGAVICALSAAAFYLFLFHFDDNDEKEYRRLMLVSNPTLANNTGQAPYTAKQKRYGVRKDITFQQGVMPLQVKLLSREAELVLDRNDDSTQIIEEMHGVKVYMQEELFYQLPDGREASLRTDGALALRGSEEALTSSAPTSKPMQVVRYLEADEGSYSYKTDKCTARNVLVERYIVEGHHLPEDLSRGQLVLRGVAESVEFSLSGGDPHFTAQRLKASIYMPEQL